MHIATMSHLVVVPHWSFNFTFLVWKYSAHYLFIRRTFPITSPAHILRVKIEKIHATVAWNFKSTCNEWKYPYTWELQLLLLMKSIRSDVLLHPQTLQGSSRILTENPAWKLRKKNSGLPETPENVRSRCSVMYTSSLSREPLGCISWSEELLNFGEVGHWLLVARLEHDIELFVLGNVL